MGTVDVRPFDDADAERIADLATTLQWPSLTDPAVVEQVCTAAGAVAYVATDTGRLIGWAQALTDGVLQAHLSFVGVHPEHRRRGIAKLLVVATFQAAGAKRMDLVTDEDAAGFYERFGHHRMAGFRLYPGA